MFSLRVLSYVVAVAEHRHFGRAAAASAVSQPTLSGQIRKLEQALGVDLFERDSRNVVPTALGEAVVAEARLALAGAERIADLARSHRDPLAGPFRLGVIATLGPYLAPGLLAALGRAAPGLALAVVEDLTDRLLAQLRAHELDAALIATEPDGDDLMAEPLFDEAFLIGLAAGHPLAHGPALAAAALGRTPLLLLAEGHCLRDQALSVCAAAGVDQGLRAASLLTVMRLAASGRGATLVPALAAASAEGLVLRPLADPAAFRRVRIVARRRFPRHGAVQVVAKAARTAASAPGIRIIGAPAPT